jgi:hypothetical protein
MCAAPRASSEAIQKSGMPGLPEHRVDERRLAVVDVRHDGDVADVLAERIAGA